eukprot:753009-Hanusia_phi.AAC.1
MSEGKSKSILKSSPTAFKSDAVSQDKVHQLLPLPPPSSFPPLLVNSPTFRLPPSPPLTFLPSFSDLVPLPLEALSLPRFTCSHVYS